MKIAVPAQMAFSIGLTARLAPDCLTHAARSGLFRRTQTPFAPPISQAPSARHVYSSRAATDRKVHRSGMFSERGINLPGGEDAAFAELVRPMQAEDAVALSLKTGIRLAAEFHTGTVWGHMANGNDLCSSGVKGIENRIEIISAFEPEGAYALINV